MAATVATFIGAIVGYLLAYYILFPVTHSLWAWAAIPVCAIIGAIVGSMLTDGQN
jgi:hypothetical protein